MTPELRAAAERLLQGARAYRDGLHNQQLDLQNVADAYLREHPADDEQLIDEAWLRSVGFINTWGDKFRNVSGDIDIVVDGETVMLAYRSDYYDTATKATRGDLRRLAAALGIELKEGA